MKAAKPIWTVEYGHLSDIYLDSIWTTKPLAEKYAVKMNQTPEGKCWHCDLEMYSVKQYLLNTPEGRTP